MDQTESTISHSDITRGAIIESFKKLHPKILMKNPVMFVVEIGSVLTTLYFVADLVKGNTRAALFSGQITLWLWFTVLFANFAEAMAEGRGKAQAESLKKARKDVKAKIRLADGEIEIV